ncbi:response regulator transcription factor [Poseidonibacter ostreae]|uniref:Response regulator n=1 Tax=Poseidonibacter ostreae TaxID=2654171 RepID=A0A6L4WPK2_9BACT|nr:response regulator [Poseidonibacter ostreae]KAB7883051.1 response regulator [Poseidonibacter ostreae]KAB7892154.1 response regulator [Poseidonibacter ostreae]
MLESINKTIKILYVEDDDIARENGVEYLENYFENIYEASDALSALKLYAKHQPHIIITDIQMPKLNGLEFVQRIRKTDSKTQVIVISAFSDKDYLLKAIELQLVKYLIKPIKENELKQALMSCMESIESDTSNIIALNDESTFDMFNLTLVKNSQIIKLRTKELDFLVLLLKNKNRYVTYSEIENSVWFDSSMSKDALKTLVKNIKTKIPKELILNLSGTGYKIDL